MKPCHPIVLVTTLLAALSLSWPSTALAAPIRIMPVGDSITEGAGGTAGRGGYRGPLWNLLVAAGHDSDFVGSWQGNSELLVDKDHDGHGGWTIGGIDGAIEGWLNGIGASPDIVLLHIGTNDFGSGASNPGAITQLDNLVTKIATLRPTAHIILTNLLERGGTANTNIQNEFNPYVQGIVEAHALAGDLISFLDMRSAVPLSDMPDQLHPNDTGYAKMAAAWIGAIEAVLEPADDVPPALVRARGLPTLDQVVLTFNRRLDPASAETAGNYSLSGGLNVLAAELSTDARSVTLTTDPQTAGVFYTLTVNNVQDQVTPTANTIAADSSIEFFGATMAGYDNNVPESDCYTLVYSLDIPSGANYGAGTITYDVDNRNLVGQYDRVAYYMELQAPGQDLQYAWASMDAFASDINTIGVPVLGTGATFQQLVANLNVVSNVPGVTTGDGQQGNIEFWPTNYEDDNTLPVPGASDLLFDFGDKRTPGDYGSMQIHNTSGAQTVIAFNNWGGTGTGVDIGIGNNPAPINGGIDWTFANNGAGLTVRKLQVLVRTSGDLTPPTLASAAANFGKDRITVVFSEPVRRETLVAGNFSLDNGVTVLGVTLGDDLHEVLLETTTQPAAALTLTVSNVRDTSPNANPIAPGSTIAVAPPTLPAEVIANIGAAADGYELVYTLDIPTVGNFNAGNPYTVDNSAGGGGFSRVAYYLELQSGANPVQYIWASMDPFTGNKGKLGVPTVASGALFAQKVSNLDVISNVAGIVNGTGLSTGNLEFWPSDYNGNNDAGVPGATTAFDFGDGGVGHGAGYGSMQIHNHGASQTLFAMNHWGTDGNNLCLGIGNRPGTGDTDWTFADNAGPYSRKVMHIMVLPSAPTPAPAAVTAAVNARAPGEADGYQLVYSLDLPASGNLVGGRNFKDYSFNDSGRSDPFSRVAYYLELQKGTDPGPTFVWVSMDAFTDDRVKIGVPSVASGALWHDYVTNLNVVSNGNVTEGTGLSGNLEFWPGNYVPDNQFGIPGANGGTFDFGDGSPGSGYGHGSMQVHNYGAGQTLFAINNWGNFAANNNFGVGIGNDPNGGATTDYTFAATAASYTVTRRLHVLVLPGGAPTPGSGPGFTAATGSTTLDRLVVTFDREVSDASAAAGNFTIDGGVTVTGATLMAGNREIALTTSAQTAGVLYTVAATGVQERAASGALITPGSTVQFTAYTPPAALANVPDAGYELIYQLAIPAAQPRWNFNTIPYSVDEAQYGERLFDRVAYLMELDGNWVYASFDPHTNRIAQIGVPTLGVSSTPFQQIVTNMNVASNVGSIVTGNGITTGNIEFWGANYEQPNNLGIPNANGGTYDFGDSMTPALGYGSMQVHDHGASQTLFAYNNWAGNSGGFSDLGIGNNPVDQPDWTFSGNAGTHTVRNLYVLARPGGVPSGDAPEILTHPCDKAVAAGGDVTFGVTMFGSGPFTYQWRHNGAPIPGATLSWLGLSSVSGADAGDYDVVVTGSNLVPTTSYAASLSLVASTPVEFWRLANGFSVDGSGPGEGDTEDKESDGLVNLLEFGFGTNPNLPDNLPLLIDGSRNGTPTIDVSFDAGVTYSALFTRRKDHGQPGSVEYTVQFSSNLANFHDSTDTPVFVADSTDDPAYEMVKVPYPTLDLDGGKARFFRVKVTAVP